MVSETLGPLNTLCIKYGNDGPTQSTSVKVWDFRLWAL